MFYELRIFSVIPRSGRGQALGLDPGIHPSVPPLSKGRAGWGLDSLLGGWPFIGNIVATREMQSLLHFTLRGNTR